MRKDHARLMGDGAACSLFPAVKASMLPSTLFHVLVHSVAKLFFNDRAFLFSLYLLLHVVLSLPRPLYCHYIHLLECS